MPIETMTIDELVDELLRFAGALAAERPGAVTARNDILTIDLRRARARS